MTLGILCCACLCRETDCMSLLQVSRLCIPWQPSFFALSPDEVTLRAGSVEVAHASVAGGDGSMMLVSGWPLAGTHWQLTSLHWISPHAHPLTGLAGSLQFPSANMSTSRGQTLSHPQRPHACRGAGKLREC